MTSFPTRSRFIGRLCTTAALIAFASHPASIAELVAQEPAQLASVGPCQLAGGGRISDCRLAYRVFGRLNADRSNVVLIPTWLQGRSEDWIPYLGPQGYVDTTRFHVIVVGALGDGRSSSPSTVPAREREAFRGLTIGDMVQSQHRLLTQRLGISHLHAVAGFSMGGMQALEWAVRYPAFLDRAVSIAGAPRIGAFDHLMWNTVLQVIENGLRSRTPADTVWDQLARLEALFIQTPAAVNNSSWDSVIRAAATVGRTYRSTWELEDFAAQLRAIRHHDISGSFGSDLARAAGTIKARVFLVYSPDDHMVTAGPALAFAPLIRADTLSVPSACGHLLFMCEQNRLAAAVRKFLAE
ncbi:MAG: homoserine O-acetyltransferase [Geminicoccaceae bacterium]|nr:homoserine O-acetyltransferase [Geminicoccaceae bacterium]